MKKEEEKEEERKNIFVLTGTKQVEKDAADAKATARKLYFSRLRLTAQMLGAKVVSEMSSEVTHIVGIIDTPTGAATENADITTTTAAAVLSPDPDTLLTALKNSSTTGIEGGNHAVQVLEHSLRYSEPGPGSRPDQGGEPGPRPCQSQKRPGTWNQI